jgi:hypothetical protein
MSASCRTVKSLSLRKESKMFGIGELELILIFFIFLPIYLLPTAIALNRKHNNAAPIIVINILCGWFFIGWVVSFAWSLTDNTKKKEKNNEKD